MEVGVLVRPLGPAERPIRMPPPAARRVPTAVLSYHGQPRRDRSSAPIDDIDSQRPHRPAIMPLTRFDPPLLAARHIDDPQRRIAALVGDVSNVLAVVRPARRGRVELAIGERKWIAALARHQPQLIPLSAEVGAVNDSLAIGRPIWPSLPGRFFVAQLAQRGAGARLHAPEAAAAVNVPAV